MENAISLSRSGIRRGLSYSGSITVTIGLQNIDGGLKTLASVSMRLEPEQRQGQAMYGLPLHRAGGVVVERLRTGQLNSSLRDWPVALRYASTACTRACCPFSEAMPSLLKMLLIWCSTVLG